MIIDDSGFLVMHQSFKEIRDANVFEDSFHITLQVCISGWWFCGSLLY